MRSPRRTSSSSRRRAARATSWLPRAAANTLAVLSSRQATGCRGRESSFPLNAPLRTATSHGPDGPRVRRASRKRGGRSSSRFFGSTCSSRRRAGVPERSRSSQRARSPTSRSRSGASPELPRLLRRLVVMGGSFDHSGNTTLLPNSTSSSIPEAAKIVLDAFLPVQRAKGRLLCGAERHRAGRVPPDHLLGGSLSSGGSTPGRNLPSPDDPAGDALSRLNPLVRCISDVACSQDGSESSVRARLRRVSASIHLRSPSLPSTDHLGRRGPGPSTSSSTARSLEA